MAQLTNVIVTPGMIREYMIKKCREQEELANKPPEKDVCPVCNCKIMQFQEP